MNYHYTQIRRAKIEKKKINSTINSLKISIVGREVEHLELSNADGGIVNCYYFGSFVVLY